MDPKATSVSVSRLRAEGVINLDSTSVKVFADLEVGVVHRIFPNGGSWSFFVCECGRRVRTLRLVDGRPLCRWCSGHGATDAVRVADRIAKLRDMLYGAPLRLKPRPGRTMDRRLETEAALRRALIVERRERLKHAPP